MAGKKAEGKKQKADEPDVRVDAKTGEILPDEADTQKQLERIKEIRATELTVARMEDEIEDQKGELKEARLALKKKQKYLRALIRSNPADELPFEE